MDNTHSSYEKQFYLGTSKCDFTGAWKLSSLLEAVQDTANEHSQELHLWISDLVEKNAAWVVYRTELQIDRYPSLGEIVKIQTFSKGIRSIFCPRYYLIKDEKNEVAARAGSLLMLIDRSSRKAIMPRTLGLEIPDATDMEPTVAISMRKHSLVGEEKKGEYLPPYSDIDVNGHVNNTRYADWLCNSMGLNYMSQKSIVTASFEYNHEVLPKEKVESVLTLHDDVFRYAGNVNGIQTFSIYGKIKKRDPSLYRIAVTEK